MFLWAVGTSCSLVQTRLLSDCAINKFEGGLAALLVPGTDASRRSPQSVKWMNHRPAADCAACRRRRLLVDLMHFVQLHHHMTSSDLECPIHLSALCGRTYVVAFRADSA